MEEKDIKHFVFKGGCRDGMVINLDIKLQKYHCLDFDKYVNYIIPHKEVVYFNNGDGYFILGD